MHLRMKKPKFCSVFALILCITSFRGSLDLLSAFFSSRNLHTKKRGLYSHSPLLSHPKSIITRDEKRRLLPRLPLSCSRSVLCRVFFVALSFPPKPLTKPFLFFFSLPLMMSREKREGINIREEKPHLFLSLFVSFVVFLSFFFYSLKHVIINQTRNQLSLHCLLKEDDDAKNVMSIK